MKFIFGGRTMDISEQKFDAIFETEVVINKNTYNELAYKFIPKGVKIIAVIFLLGCTLSIIQGYNDAVSGIMTVILFISFLIFFQKRNIKMELKRQQEREGTPESKLVISFSDDKIRLYNPRSGGVVYLNYDSVVKFVETKNFYVLRTKASQDIIVNKITLIEAQKENDFIRFLEVKCKNVRWRSPSQ